MFVRAALVLLCLVASCTATSGGEITPPGQPTAPTSAPAGAHFEAAPPHPSNRALAPPPRCGDGRTDWTANEECDGADVGGATCASFHLRGSVLGCTPTCHFDTTGCDPCPIDPRVAACAREPVDARGAQDLALASKAAEVVVAWVSAAPDVAGVHLARFGPDLGLVAESTIDTQPSVTVALAPSATGYMLAFAQRDGVHVQPLDGAAHALGPARTIVGAVTPRLAAVVTAGAPARGPLLIWGGSQGSASDVEEELLANDGTEVAPPRVVMAPALGTFASGIFTGRQFVLALDSGEPHHHLTTMSIGSDGKPGSPRQLADHGSRPELVWTGTEARVVYHDGVGTRSMRLDPEGRPLGTPEPVIAYDHTNGGDVRTSIEYGSPLFVYGNTVLPLLGELFDSHPLPPGFHRSPNATFSSLALLQGTPPAGRVTAGSPEWLFITSEIPAAFAAVRLGGDVVMGWIAQRQPRSLVLARVLF